MQKNIYLPNVELNMEGVKVTEWRVAVGDSVAADQILMEVETQKAAVEVPSPESGYVRRLCVAPREEVAEKALLCILTDSADEAFVDPSAPSMPSPAFGHPSQPLRLADSAPPRKGEEDGGIRAVPLARKMAREAGIELSSIAGTGPQGRITAGDVEAAIVARGSGDIPSLPSPLGEVPSPRGGGAGEVPSPRGGGAAEGTWEPLPAARIALNAQMTKSLAEIPQIALSRQFDVTVISQKSEGLTFTHRLIRATATALTKHPALRTRIEGNRIQALPVSVAVAMDTPHGLVAPVVRQADRLAVAEISRVVTDFRNRGMSNGLRREELIDGPFAITNLGMLDVDFFTPFVFHGQTAVLAVGRATRSGAGQSAWFTLAVDHRVVDGAEAARFLETLQQAILSETA